MQWTPLTPWELHSSVSLRFCTICLFPEQGLHPPDQNHGFHIDKNRATRPYSGTLPRRPSACHIKADTSLVQPCHEESQWNAKTIILHSDQGPATAFAIHWDTHVHRWSTSLREGDEVGWKPSQHLPHTCGRVHALHERVAVLVASCQLCPVSDINLE